jgi:O-antigen/teichoic acid export membrane protein
MDQGVGSTTSARIDLDFKAPTGSPRAAGVSSPASELRGDSFNPGSIMKVQFLVMLATRILAAGIQAVSVVLLARWVGIEDFGLISVLLGIGGVLFTVSDWGLSSYIPRARAKGENSDVAAGLRMNFAGNGLAGMLFAAVVLIIGFTSGEPLWLGLLPLALALDQVSEAGLTVVVADKLKRPVVVSVLLRRCTALALFVGLYATGLDAVGAYAVGLLSSAIIGQVHVQLVVRARMKGVTDRTPYRLLYRRLTPYMTANLSAASRSLDTSVVAMTTSVSTAGLYSAAFRITRPLMLVGSAAVAVILPHAARESLSVVQKLAWRLSAAAVASVLPLIALSFWSEPIVLLLFGGEYRGAAPAFALAVIAIPFLSLAPPLGGMLQGQGHQNFVARNGIVFAVVTLGLVWVGAILFGVTGASGGILAAYVLKCAALLIRLMRVRPPAAGADAVAPAGVDALAASTARA